MSLMADLTVKNAFQSDLDAVAELETIGFSKEEAATREALEYRLINYPEWFLTARADGKIVGFIDGILSKKQLITDEAYLPGREKDGRNNLLLFGLVIYPNYRRKGIAEKLMRTVLQNAEKRGIKNVALTCRKTLIPYYEKFGFKSLGVSESVIGNVTWYDMVIEK